MIEKKNIGYEITVCSDNEQPYVFCVDQSRKVRSWYTEEASVYFSDWERWVDHDGFGTLEGDLKRGSRVTIYNESYEPFTCGGAKMNDCLVTRIQEVDIDKMIEHSSIAGIDEPIWKQYSIN